MALHELQALPAPELALLLWGREFSAEPGTGEREPAHALQSAGVQIVVDAHPHRSSRRIAAVRGLDTVLAYSLGNFVFDQRARRASGAVLPISRVAQGAHRALTAAPAHQKQCFPRDGGDVDMGACR